MANHQIENGFLESRTALEVDKVVKDICFQFLIHVIEITSLQKGMFKAFLGTDSLVRLFIEHFFKKILSFFRHLIPAFLCEVKRLLANIIDQLLSLITIEWKLSSDHQIHHNAACPYVYRRLVRGDMTSLLVDLRCNVFSRSKYLILSIGQSWIIPLE